VEEHQTRDVEALLRDNESLREQRRAVGDVLRAVARSEGLQPVLDEIVDTAKQLWNASLPTRLTRPPRSPRCLGDREMALADIWKH
jgi:hypothetical protein